MRPQRGATALEFALIFPLLFALLYGVVVYSYVFVIQESITYAAQQAASATVRVDPNDNAENYIETLREQARASAVRTLSWLPDPQQDRVLGNDGEAVDVELVPDVGGSIVEVDLRFNLDGLFPRLSLPGVGVVPPLPEVLTASASILVGENVALSTN